MTRGGGGGREEEEKKKSNVKFWQKKLFLDRDLDLRKVLGVFLT